jgi:translocon-associated protein subunit gamma
MIGKQKKINHSLLYNYLLYLNRVLTRKNEVADFEATTFSIFYNNAFYLVCLIVLSFFVFKNFSPTVNYLFSVGLSTAIVFLFSTGEK